MENKALLEVKGLSVAYGAVAAVRGLDLHVREGEVVALLGANGAGKTSTLKAITGLVPYGGEVSYRGQSLRGRQAHEIVGLGIAHVPEGRGIFGNLTVRENLRLATWQRRDGAAEIEADYGRVFGYFPRLREREGQSAGTLSGGEQQMLALGRALMSRGSLLLLDEPSMGLSPILVQEIMSILVEINRAGTTVLLVEQNANMALRIATRGYVLETGTVVTEGSAGELRDNPAVREAYLG